MGYNVKSKNDKDISIYTESQPHIKAYLSKSGHSCFKIVLESYHNDWEAITSCWVSEYTVIGDNE